MENNRIKAVAFDLEGTIVNLEPIHHLSWVRAIKELTGTELNIEKSVQLFAHFIGGPDESVAEDISKYFEDIGIQVQSDDFARCKTERYNKLFEDYEINPRQGFLDVLRQIIDLGIPYAIGSLTPAERAINILERAGLMQIFKDRTVFSEDVERPKPAPDVWYKTAEISSRSCKSINPQFQLVFEDSPRGIQGGVTIGAYCVGMPIYNRPHVIVSLIEAGARRVFMEWDEMRIGALIKNIADEYRNHA